LVELCFVFLDLVEPELDYILERLGFKGSTLHIGLTNWFGFFNFRRGIFCCLFLLICSMGLLAWLSLSSWLRCHVGLLSKGLLSESSEVWLGH
jgi:hypothetical protein